MPKINNGVRISFEIFRVRMSIVHSEHMPVHLVINPIQTAMQFVKARDHCYGIK